MQFKYITFKDGHKFLLNTPGVITSNSSVIPNEYNSYYTSQDLYGTMQQYNLPNAIVGYVKDGSYYGYRGVLEDYNGNTYTIRAINSTVTVIIKPAGGVESRIDITRECTLKFTSSFPDSTTGKSSVGLQVTYPWDGGSYADVTPGGAWGCFKMSASYDDFVSMYSDKSIFHAECITNDMGVYGQWTDTQDRNYFGFNVISGNTTTGLTIPIGTGEGEIQIDESIEDFDPDEDPYNDPDEGTHAGGGDGNHDKSSDPVDFPAVPSLSATDSGFVTIFNPSLAQLRSLASYMWSGLFDIDTFKKLFANPMDAILGLSIVPVNVPSGTSKAVKVGNISTGVNMNVASSQYVTVDCGSLDIKEYWGSYLDYEPYTKMELFLPFIGMRTISSDEVMNTTIHIKYNVDILSGACVAFVKCGNSVLYTFEGQCSCIIPVSNTDWSATIMAAVQAATAIGTLAATGGASAALSAEAEGARAQMMAAKRTSQWISTGGSVVSSAMNAVKPQIQKSGGISGSGALLGGKKPYLIITRPKQAVPGNQNRYQGYPSFVTTTLGGLSGYTEIDSIILEGIPASDTELSEIVSLLQGGVIL